MLFNKSKDSDYNDYNYENRYYHNYKNHYIQIEPIYTPSLLCLFNDESLQYHRLNFDKSNLEKGILFNSSHCSLVNKERCELNEFADKSKIEDNPAFTIFCMRHDSF